MKTPAIQRLKATTRATIIETAFSMGGKLAPSFTAARLLRFFCATRRHPLPKRELEYLAEARALTFRNGLRGYAWGPSPREAPPVLLVHGWSGRGTQLGAIGRALAAAGFAAIAVDGPGHGESQGSSTDALQFSDALTEVAAELGPLRAVVAHSFGVGCTIWAGHKGLSAARLVLIGSPDSYGSVVDAFAARLRLSPAVKREFTARLERRVGLRLAELEMGRMGAALEACALIVHDANDRDVPWAAAERLHASWPGSRLLRTEGLGHRRVLRDEATIEALIDFVRG